MKSAIIATLVIVAGCSAIVVPNLYIALQRSKQKRSMGDMLTWSRAIEEYTKKHGHAPRPGYAGPVTGIASLAPAEAPLVDGWGHPFLYHGVGDHYSLRSRGRDGVNDRVLSGVATNYDDDFVFADGIFLRYPEGL